MSEKDRFGDKLREVERGREDHYFAEKDRELIEKTRRQQHDAAESARREASRNRCPKCGEELRQRVVHEITVDDCPDCGGIWLDRGEFEQLARREKDGWFARLLGAPKS